MKRVKPIFGIVCIIYSVVTIYLTRAVLSTAPYAASNFYTCIILLFASTLGLLISNAIRGIGILIGILLLVVPISSFYIAQESAVSNNFLYMVIGAVLSGIFGIIYLVDGRKKRP